MRQLIERLDDRDDERHMCDPDDIDGMSRGREWRPSGGKGGEECRMGNRWL